MKHLIHYKACSPVSHGSANASCSVAAGATVTAASKLSGNVSPDDGKNVRPADKCGIELYTEKGKEQMYSENFCSKKKVIALSENMLEDHGLDIVFDPKKTCLDLNSCFPNIIELPTVQLNKGVFKAARNSK